MEGYSITEDERRSLIDSIPRASVVDACKENIQPRKSGRSVASLTTLFETNPNEREREIALGRKKFEEQLDSIEDLDDPLDIYIQHINWTHTMYPQGQSSESSLVELLSDATNRFKTDPQYKSDARYLKLWLEYAHYVEDPLKIFSLLINEDIGQDLALFYEEYSAYFERLKKVKEAVEVYEKGIQRTARPIRRLQKNLIHLKSRIHERQQRGLLKKERHEARTQMDELRQQGRTMLGQKFDSRSRSSVSSNVFSAIEAATSSPHTTLSRSRTFGNDRPSASTSSSYQSAQESEISSPSSSFSVYVETAPTSPSTNLFSRSSAASLLLPASHRKVENQYPVEKFSGATIPQAEIVSQPIEPFTVYQDDTSTTPQQQQHNIRSLERSDSMLSISTGEESTVSKIRRNPTFDYPSSSKRLRQDAYVVQQSAETEKHDKEMRRRFVDNKHNYLKTTNSKGGTEYITVSNSMGSEMSFEEYRVSMKQLPVVDSCWSDYKKNVEMEKKNKEPDLTTGTILALKSVKDLFDEPDAYDEEEEKDLTWTNPFQEFTRISRPPSNENE